MDDTEITCDQGDVEMAIEALVAYVGPEGALWEYAQRHGGWPSPIFIPPNPEAQEPHGLPELEVEE